DPEFLGGGDARVALPDLSAGQSVDAATPQNPRSGDGTERFLLPYTHFSAVNVDGRQLRRIPRSGDKWMFDPRIDRILQAGDDIYRQNDLDRGHMTRRLDPVWGTPAVAAIA